MNKNDKPRPTIIIAQAAKKIAKTNETIDTNKKEFEKEWQRWGVKKKGE